MDADTKCKIEKHIRKHRARGGMTEMGVDDAEKDLKDKPTSRNAPNNVAKEAEEMKAKKGGRVKRAHGGKMMKEVKMEGEHGHHHAGRKRRASGGGCESNPFTTALKGHGAGKTERESQGRND